MPKIKQESEKQEKPIDKKESINMEDSTSIAVVNNENESLDSTVKPDGEPVDYEDLKKMCQWSLGDVVWARFGHYPFWPSVVTLDPYSKTYVIQKGTNSKYRYLQVHVRFCADKGRHNWISSTNLIPFEGLADFENRYKGITPEIKKKEPKFAAAFVIKTAVKYKWDDAVGEATLLKSMTNAQINEILDPDNEKMRLINKSLDIFLKDDEKRKSLLDGTYKGETYKDETVKKRKKSTENNAPAKKSKVNGKSSKKTNEDSNLEDSSLEDSIIDDLNLETPPTPPSSNKDSSDEAQPFMGVFEIYCERYRERALQQDPNATEEDINEYLLRSWNNMPQQDRLKFRGDFLDDEEIKLYGMRDDEYEDRENLRHSNMEVEETTSNESEVREKPSARKRKQKRHESSDRDDVVSIESGEKPVKKRKSKLEELPCIETSPSPFQYKLFKGLRNERVCQICEKPGKLIRCRGPCFSYFHSSCVKPGESSPEPSEAGDLEDLKDVYGNEAYNEDLREIKEKLREKKQQQQQQRESDENEKSEDENFKCIDCLSGIAPPCFICHERDDCERFKCSAVACGKHYHMKCLKGWPQSHWQGERLTCPYHVCHTCISDNPQNGHYSRVQYEKFARCIRCPSAYHAQVLCLPAGSNILTGNHIVCPKHYDSGHPPVNATWCFLCTKGGSLICCDTCPMSFHLECLGIDAPEGGFICEDCETGRLPLYGEVVWVKHGNYRWWPSVVCAPEEIPHNIATKPHRIGEFCIMFLGTRDYCWVHRGKVFLFQDGDANGKVIGSKKVEDSYRKAIKEAKFYHERYTYEKSMAKSVVKDTKSHKPLKPPPYVKLKVNKPVGTVKNLQPDSLVACNCDPNVENPCSPESDCLNRILMIECSPDTCPAKTNCQNQMFAQRNYPSMKPFHTDGRGWGLKVLEHVTQGQFVIEYVGEVIDEAEYRLRIELKKERKNENYYFLTIDNNRMIDAEPKGNLSRFMNHSCLPNCETQKWTVNGDTRIGLFALRDIEPGEELTFNYNLACDGETKKPCLCKAPNCSGFIGLKASKQTISITQQKSIEKAEKAEKVKKQRKYKRTLICWNCNLKIDNANEAFKCDKKSCGKNYHPQCLAIEDGPDQTFHCPWHYCAECYEITSLRCSYCCNAFCQAHTYGNLREHPKNGTLICYNHPTELVDCYEMNMGEALMDDDGETDDDVVITYENYMPNYIIENDEISGQIVTSSPNKLMSSLSTLMPSTPTTTATSVDETSPRGEIVEVQPDSDLSILSKNDSTSSCNKDDEDEIPLDKRWKNWVKANSSNYTKLSTNQRIIIDVDELSTDQILSTIIGLVE